MPSYVHLIVVLLTQLHFTFCGQDCLSCTNVASPSSCHYTLTCADNEVCYKHKFISHSGSVSYDLGCAYQQTCSHLTGSIFGKRRSEGRRQICSECCNSTRLCNRDLPCLNTVSNGTILPRECSDIADVKTGVYDIYPDGVLPAVMVYCVVNETKRWTVIQRRINGCTDFYRGWEAYKEGFGNSSGEYWLGNENIHKISSHGRHALRVELSDFDNQVRYAEYEMFSIGDERDGYQLAVGGYSGNAETMTFILQKTAQKFMEEPGGIGVVILPI
ncbi:microfibril-associated glycoprotein 4-like [Mytilus galloprovincialis]|uniref:microfibril-associated glycoprotein 4-like n=1 Tax=Mytilus galloprovincialis TaxID=29158 RepID=UPI003F7CA052